MGRKGRQQVVSKTCEMSQVCAAEMAQREIAEFGKRCDLRLGETNGKEEGKGSGVFKRAIYSKAVAPMLSSSAISPRPEGRGSIECGTVDDGEDPFLVPSSYQHGTSSSLSLIVM